MEKKPTEAEKLRAENKILKDEVRHLKKIIQRLEDGSRRNETRCDVYQRHLLALLGEDDPAPIAAARKRQGSRR